MKLSERYCYHNQIREGRSMKRSRRLFLMLACALVLVVSAPAAAAGAKNAQETEAQAGSAAQKAKKGWYTLKNGKKRYYRNGKYVTGLQKIGKKRYYFKSNGVMRTGTVTVKKTTYYLSDTGVLRARKTGSFYYDANGKRMNAARREVFKAEQNARDVIKSVTTSKMTKSQKLRACFDWVMKKNYWSWRQLSQCSISYWPAYYANDHFERGKGDCHADACAFAYLAKELGYKKVYVCTDGKKSTKNAHSWTEINGRVYDPLFAQSKSFSGNYGVKYGVYKLYPIMRTKI